METCIFHSHHEWPSCPGGSCSGHWASVMCCHQNISMYIMYISFVLFKRTRKCRLQEKGNGWWMRMTLSFILSTGLFPSWIAGHTETRRPYKSMEEHFSCVCTFSNPENTSEKIAFEPIFAWKCFFIIYFKLLNKVQYRNKQRHAVVVKMTDIVSAHQPRHGISCWTQCILFHPSCALNQEHLIGWYNNTAYCYCSHESLLMFVTFTWDPLC